MPPCRHVRRAAVPYWSGDLLTAAEKVGDYPLIDAETARCLLLNGDYITTVPSEYLRDGTITEPQIAKTELVYRTGNTAGWSNAHSA